MVTASRDYVCVRPQTYEDQAEAELLLSLFKGRQGELENTVFCVLGPDGKERLTRAGRSPSQQFADAQSFAAFLGETYEPYAEKAKPLAGLPLHDELALALNVGACDLMPVGVLVAEDEKSLTKLKERVARLAWSPEHIARQHFVCVVGSEAIAAAEEAHGLVLKPGLSLVEPDAFGRTATLLIHVESGASVAGMGRQLAKARAERAPSEKSRRAHIREARRAGIGWESELPVSDPGARRAKREER